MMRALVALAIVCASEVCRADTAAPTVLVLLERPDDAAALVASEIAAAGMSPAREMLARSDAGPGELADAARATGARAVMRLKADAVEIWIVRDDVGLVFLESMPRAEDDVTAVRGVERVRAALRWDARPAPAVPAPPAESPEPSRGLGSRFVLGAGLAVLASPGGVDPIGGARGAIGYSVTERLRLEITGSVPLTHAVFDRPAGRASVTTTQAALSAIYLPSSGRVRPFVLGSGGLLVLSASGDAVTPNTSSSGRAAAPVVAAGGGALVRLVPHVALRADATLGAALAPLRVGILDHAEATLGAPILTAGLGFEGSLEP
jgi:hypothetical protein